MSDVLLQLFNDLQAKSGLNDDPNDKPDEYEYTTAQTELLPEPDADKFQNKPNHRSNWRFIPYPAASAQIRRCPAPTSAYGFGRYILENIARNNTKYPTPLSKANPCMACKF
ncbi:MAG: hypothetical protein IPL33_06480 [Sphingobacteriales bacterium]|nr:hypothetical protein [Sphingobacteriales bacterium]